VNDCPFANVVDAFVYSLDSKGRTKSLVGPVFGMFRARPTSDRDIAAPLIRFLLIEASVDEGKTGKSHIMSSKCMNNDREAFFCKL
jgi:hypothetical protein